MAKDPMCNVDVGTHIAPYWKDLNSNLQVCARHRMQYEERVEDFGPYNWENVPICQGCGTMESNEWWKCCLLHCTEEGIDVLCDACAARLHPPVLLKDKPIVKNGQVTDV